MKKALMALLMFIIGSVAQAQTQAQAPEVYAVSKPGQGGTLTLYAVRDRCPGNSRLAVFIKYGVSTPGCWIWGSEEFMVKYWENWDRARLYDVENFDKDPYYIQQEEEYLKKQKSKR